MNELTQVFQKTYRLRNGLYQYESIDWIVSHIKQVHCKEWNELHRTLVLLNWVAPNFESVRIDN